MSFNPKYGAVNPYGDATPNRVGVSGDYKFKNNKIETSLFLNLLTFTGESLSALKKKMSKELKITSSNLR